jgi:hypothetical protein
MFHLAEEKYNSEKTPAVAAAEPIAFFLSGRLVSQSLLLQNLSTSSFVLSLQTRVEALRVLLCRIFVRAFGRRAEPSSSASIRKSHIMSPYPVPPLCLHQVLPASCEVSGKTEMSMRANLLSICDSKSDNQAVDVCRRLSSITNLVSVHARYHHNCMYSFKVNKTNVMLTDRAERWWFYLLQLG